ncbi:hypothetical protein GOV11_02490 [Candidatus Woesearchaeota archaeon]|nr:hypothetical protein [Candidatus Woesearchaeota archaeon]
MTRRDIDVVKTRTMVVALLLCVLMLSGCTWWGGRNNNSRINEYAKYYKGSDGIQARYVSFPTRLYYYGAQDTSANDFTLGVELWNKGASYSRGGIYISGYDPNMIMFDEIPIRDGGVGACGIGLGNIGFGEYGVIVRCDGTEVIAGDRTSIRIDSIADLIRGIGDRFSKNWWPSDNVDFSVGYDSSYGENFFWINVGDLYANVEWYQNGILLIQILSGINFNINGGIEFLLAGDTYEFPGGESDFLVYNGHIVDWPIGLDQTQQTFMMTSCYLYTTYADPVVCIDPAPFDDVRKVCYPRSRTWNGGNGAPVGITSIEQENSPRKIIFRINVKNIGRGTVWDPGQLERCSPYYPGRVTLEHKNTVYVGDVRVGSIGLIGRGGREGISCYPNPIRLDPNTQAGSTTCTYPIQFTSIKSAYQSPLVVELWYGYSEVQMRQVTIKRVV